MEETEARFFIRDTRSFVGNCVVWWHESRSGYTTHLDDALKVDAAEAERIHANRETDVAVPVQVALRAATLQVDVQRLGVDP